MTHSVPDGPGRRWAVKRIALSLDRALYGWMQAQRTRLHSLSDAELARDLLREHQTLLHTHAALTERVIELERVIVRLQAKVKLRRK
jgi:hypothetical protein